MTDAATPATTRDERPAAPRPRRLLFALAIPVMLFLLGECALRVKSRITSGTWDHRVQFRSPGHELFERHFHLGNVPVAGATYEGGGVRVTINDRGFRGPAVQVPKPHGTFRIVVLGGSAVFGTRNTANDRTWPARLEARLREAVDGRNIEVVNGGCSGYDTLTNLINLQCRVLELDPDLVLVYSAFNDLKINRVGTFRPDHSNDARLPEEPSLLRCLADASILVLTIERHLEGPRVPSKRWDTVDPAGPRAFRRDLESLAAVCRQHGVDIALLTFARPWEDEIPGRLREGWVMRGFTSAGLRSAYETYNRTIRQTAAALGVPLIDAARLVPRDPSLFADAVHFNDAGADRMAAAISPAVVPLVR